MSFAEDEYRTKAKKKDPINALLQALGLILIVVLGAVAFVLREPVHELLMDNIADFPADANVGYVVGGVIFLVLVMLVALIYAMFAPKPTKLVSEKQLKKEKEDKEKERLAQKRRQKQIRQKMAEERKKAGK